MTKSEMAHGEGGARTGAETPSRAVAWTVVELSYRSSLVAFAIALLTLGGPASMHAQTARVE
jgi:hypothetical protein